VKLNIFSNPFIHRRVAELTESYWRETISENILKFGAKIESKLPTTTAGEIHHGEEMLRQWAKYIINECAKIAKGEDERS
jgi:hypothetical protein